MVGDSVCGVGCVVGAAVMANGAGACRHSLLDPMQSKLEALCASTVIPWHLSAPLQSMPQWPSPQTSTKSSQTSFWSFVQCTVQSPSPQMVVIERQLENPSQLTVTDALMCASTTISSQLCPFVLAAQLTVTCPEPE